LRVTRFSRSYLIKYFCRLRNQSVLAPFKYVHGLMSEP
jgi:hypothetical protein